MNFNTYLPMPNKASLYVLIANRELDNGSCSEDNIQDFVSPLNFKEACTNEYLPKLFYLSKCRAIKVLA